MSLRMLPEVEARDFPNGIFSSLCAMGQGSGQMGELSARRRRCHLEIQADILAGELYVECSLTKISPGGKS